MTVIFFDLETSGLIPHQHDVTQIAAVAVDNRFNPVDQIEIKVLFDVESASAEALDVSAYDPDVWAAEAIAPSQAIHRFVSFMRRHASVRKISRRTGNQYTVAQMAGYNSERFDNSFFVTWAQRHCPDVFIPMEFITLDVMQMVVAMRVGLNIAAGLASYDGTKSYKLTEVCSRLGVPLDNAHDALGDVRATVEVARLIFHRLGIIPQQTGQE